MMFQKIDFSENLNFSFQTKNNPKRWKINFPSIEKHYINFKHHYHIFLFSSYFRDISSHFFGTKKFLSLRNEKVGGWSAFPSLKSLYWKEMFCKEKLKRYKPWFLPVWVFDSFWQISLNSCFNLNSFRKKVEKGHLFTVQKISL
jgi:hypothetical protein